MHVYTSIHESYVKVTMFSIPHPPNFQALFVPKCEPRSCTCLHLTLNIKSPPGRQNNITHLLETRFIKIIFRVVYTTILMLQYSKPNSIISATWQVDFSRIVWQEIVVQTMHPRLYDCGIIRTYCYNFMKTNYLCAQQSRLLVPLIHPI